MIGEADCLCNRKSGCRSCTKILEENGYYVASQNGQELRVRICINEKNDVVKLLISHNVVMTGLYEAIP